MQVQTALAVLCFLSVRCSYGQDINILGEAAGYYDIWSEEENTGNAPQLTEVNKDLCEHYDFYLNDKRIDCTSIKLVHKILKTDTHNINKREADEDQVEGSGESDPEEESPVAEENKADNETKEAAPGALVEPEVPEEKTEEEKSTAPEKTEESTGEIVPYNVAVAPKVNEATEEPKAEQKPDDTDKKEDSATENSADKVDVDPKPEDRKPEEPKAEEPKAEEPKAEEPKTEEPTAEVPKPEEPKEDEPKVAGESTGVKASDDTEKKKVDEESVKQTFTNLQNAPVPLPETSKGKESEDMNDHQSGNAVIDKVANVDGGNVEGSDAVNVQRKMDPNADTKRAASISEKDEPKSGESAKEADKGRKDTTILIVLFAAVVVVGVAAFGYKMIVQKRKKNAAPAGSQNGLATREDPEQGKEMKPLMNQAAPVTEYTDERKAEDK